MTIRWTPRGLVPAVVGVLLAGSPSIFQSSAQVIAAADKPTLVDALEAYGRGSNIRPPGTAESLRFDLSKTGRAWVEAGPPTDRARRKNVVALVALDSAIAVTPTFWPDAQVLIEWACDYLRSGTPTPFEHEWMMAVIALGEQHRDESLLLDGSCRPPTPCNHVRHAMSRFPDDPVFQRAQLFARTELNVVTRRPGLSASALVEAPPPGYPINALLQTTESDAKRIGDTLAQLSRLASNPLRGVDATLRLGILEYELGRLDDSRRDLQAVASRTSDAAPNYFAHLVMGLGLASANQRDGARQEYEAAVAIDPLILSGATELATDDFLSGRRDEGALLLDRALAASPAHEDPWQFPCADCMGWTDRLVRLHQDVRQ